MNVKFTRAPTTTKAAIAAAVFSIAFLATGSDLPSCSDPAAALATGGRCVIRQSYLHTACGWLALASLITGVALFILKQRKASSADHQARPRPAGSEAPRPAEVPMAAQAPMPARAPRPAEAAVPEAQAQASKFCTRCGTRAVAADNFCQQCGAPVKAGTGIHPQNSAASY